MTSARCGGDDGQATASHVEPGPAAAGDSDALLDTLLATAPVGLGFVDRDLRYRRINRSLAAINGRPVTAHLGRTVRDVLPTLAPTLEPLLRRVIETGEAVVDLEISGESPAAPAREGSWLVSYYPVRAEGGPILGVGIIVTEITERKRGDAALRESEERLRRLADASATLASSLDYETTLQSVARLSIPFLADACTIDMLGEDGVVRRLAVAYADPAKVAWVWQVTEQPLDWNAPYGPAKVLRTGESELIPEITDAMLVAAARSERHLAFLRKAGVRSHMIVPLRSPARVLGAITFVSAESGRRYGADELALAEDLARRASLAVENARLHRAEQQARAEAETALRVRDEFLASASHDLKTPLTMIRGRAQLLRRVADTLGNVAPARLLEGLTAIESATGRMTRLVEELVDLSRLGSGRPLELQREPVDLIALVRECAADHQRTAPRHEISLQADLTRLVGDWEAPRLERVIANLLANAIRYSPDGGQVVLSVERCVDERGEWAQIAVRDSGVGIPAADLPHIFERFHRGANVTGRIAGTGIGLASARQIVEQHGGTVAVESELGAGSTFIVRLPLG